jgi:hypothetical protein
MGEWIEKAEPVKPLQQVDRERPVPPVNPTGSPEPPQPMPLKELMGFLEGAGKALLDSGMDLEKAFANISKISSMAGISDKDKETVAKAEDFAKKVTQLKESVAAVAREVSEFRKGLSVPDAGWIQKPVI